MRQLLATATAVLLLTGLAACSDDDPTPKFETSTESPATTDPPSSTPTSEPPTSTPPAEPETAEAFLRRWISVSNVMQKSGDTTEFRTLQRSCKSCAELADFVDQVHSSGGFIKTRGSEISSPEEVGRSNGVVVYEFDLRSSPTKYSVSADSPVQELAGGVEHLQVNLVDTPAGWVITRQSRVPA